MWIIKRSLAMRRWIKLPGDTEMKEYRREYKKKGVYLVEVMLCL